jgi:hypothetical protein
LPAGEPVHDRVEVPEPLAIDVEDSLQTRLVEFVATPRETVPVKPFSGTTVIVEFPTTATLTVTEVGLALIVKSGELTTWYTTLAEWERLLLVPVTVAR